MPKQFIQPPVISPNGFTLVELMLVMSIIFILAGASAPLFSTFLTSSQLQESGSNASLLIRTAYERARSGMNDSAHGVYLDIDPLGADQIIMYQGSSYATRNNLYDVVVEFEEALEFSTTITSNEINFARHTSVPSDSGSITIDHINGSSQTININTHGIIE